MTFQQMLERIRYEGAYPTYERAEDVTRAVLGALGRQLSGDERVDLAACHPSEAALVFTSQIPDLQPLTGWGFVKDLATRTGTTPRSRAGTPAPSSPSSAAWQAPASWTASSPSSRPDTRSCSAAPNSPRPPDRSGWEQAGTAAVVQDVAYGEGAPAMSPP